MRVGDGKGRQQYYSSDSFDLKDAHKFDKKDHLIQLIRFTRVIPACISVKANEC